MRGYTFVLKRELTQNCFSISWEYLDVYILEIRGPAH